MGLIKTGLTLAGGYGLIKAASKAANEYEEKKQNRQTSSSQQYRTHCETQMGTMYGNQMSNPHAQPQSRPSYQHQPCYANNMDIHLPQPQLRTIDQASMSHEKLMDSPPLYYQTHPDEMQGQAQAGLARDYYKSN